MSGAELVMGGVAMSEYSVLPPQFASLGSFVPEWAQKNEAENVRLKSLITMYENMKPRDAAKIFNGLDDGVLVEVASKINPRTMSEILAQMQADVAQRLTVELASKAQQGLQAGAGPVDLPKIDGQPTAK